MPLSWWDVDRGGCASGVVHGSAVSKVVTTLGKRFSLADGFGPQRAFVLRRFSGLLYRLLSRSPSPEEVRRYLGITVGGFLNYAPLVGCPFPTDLQRFDMRVGSYLRGFFHASSRSERIGFHAPSSAGSLAVPSILGLALQAIARELLVLLMGSSLSSLLARDALRRLMSNRSGYSYDGFSSSFFLADAVSLLAAFGWFVECQSDRFVGRVSWALSQLLGVSPACIFSPLLRSSFALSGFSIVGPVRAVIRRVVSVVPVADWASPEAIKAAVPLNFVASPEMLIGALGRARRSSSSDWSAERGCWGCPRLPSDGSPFAEDWPALSWDSPLIPPASFPRLAALDHPSPVNFGCLSPFAFTDGSYSAASGRAGSAAGFEGFPLGGLSCAGVPCGPRFCSSLPRFFGAEETHVHLAEGLAALWAVARLPRDSYSAWGADRQALFQLASSLQSASPRDLVRGSSLVLGSRFRAVLLGLKSGPPLPPPPVWEPALRSLSLRSPEIVVGDWLGPVFPVKVKAHVDQSSDLRSSARFLAVGNERQDSAAGLAASVGDEPQSVFWPTGGFLFFLSHEGRMVTRDPSRAVRRWVRESARAAWGLRPVHGLLGRIGTGVCPSCYE